MGGRPLQRAGRHCGAQDRARHRGRVLAQGYDRALQQAGAAGKGRLRAGHHLDRRRPCLGAGGRRGEGADDLLGRYHAGRRRREAFQAALSVSQHRQRVRSGDVVVARHQALEGKVHHGGWHQPRLLVRPQQYGGVRRDPETLQHRPQGRHRAVAQGRDHGSDQPRRGAQGGEAGPHLFLAAVRRSACVHETGTRGGADAGHKARVPGAGSTR